MTVKQFTGLSGLIDSMFPTVFQYSNCHRSWFQSPIYCGLCDIVKIPTMPPQKQRKDNKKDDLLYVITWGSCPFNLHLLTVSGITPLKRISLALLFLPRVDIPSEQWTIFSLPGSVCVYCEAAEFTNI